MYGSQSSRLSASSRGRRSSTSVSAYTPTNHQNRASRLPASASRNSAMKISNDHARYSSVASSIVPSSAVRRMSSVFKTPAKQTGFKDTRNLTNRDVQSTMHHKIMDFLIAADYPQLNEKFIRAPTKSEFIRMFEFILTQLDNQYQFEGKIEEEMPLLMRNLGYPVALKPSTMQTIGASHTMPHLFGAITWLIDAINARITIVTFIRLNFLCQYVLFQIADKISPQDYLLASEDDSGEARSLMYGYTIRCYKALGDVPGRTVDPSDLETESERLLIILEEHDEIVATSGELNELEETLQKEWNELQKSAGDLGQLDTELAASREDYAKVKDYQDQMKKSLSGIEKALGENNIKLSGLERKMTELREDNAEKESIIANQKMSGETARQLRSQKTEFNNQTKQIQDAMTKIDKEIYDLRKAGFGEGITMRNQYTDFVRELGNIQRHFNAIDDSFEAVMQQHSPNEPNFLSFLDEIREHIKMAEKDVKSYWNELEEKDARLNEEINTISEQKEVLKNEFDKLQRSIEMKKHSQMLKREDWTEEIRKMQLELDVAQNELSVLHGAKNTKANSREQLAAMKKVYQMRKIAIQEAQFQLSHEISAKLDRVFEEWDHIQECRAQLRKTEKMLRDAFDKYISVPQQ
ncbi:unnamed protein product [Anisakis simplex]|uniref:Kinetochore protein NDC80 n=1 Tax=Anisakis simplex TaxID=6269 RepID=A0A0M3K432_ANISI|nr:unnamed protein product [Anisakis simplex]